MLFKRVSLSDDHYVKSVRERERDVRDELQLISQLISKFWKLRKLIQSYFTHQEVCIVIISLFLVEFQVS